MIALLFALYRFAHRLYCFTDDYCRTCDNERFAIAFSLIDLIVEAAALICLWRALS